MTLRNKTLLSLIVLCLFAVQTGWTKEKSMQDLMHDKLALAQQMFVSLAKEDYAAMEKQAIKLGELTHEAAWLAHSTPEYQRESVEFERSTYMLAEAAKEKNLGATTLGFLNVNMSCASCHQYLRDAHDVEIKNVRELPQPKIEAEVEDANYWMAKKLQLSTQIQAAIAVGDFETIAHNAEAIGLLSHVEGWARRKDVNLYRAQLESFRRANDDLRRHAEEKDLPGASLAFTQVTLSCVKCHHQLRSEH
jgi:hypothetical protein